MKTAPRLELNKIGAQGSRQLARQARKVAIKLVRYPYFVVLKGFDLAGDPDEFKRLVWAMGDRAGATEQATLSFTEVKVDPVAVKMTKGATAYSRTHLPLAPHTDSSYLPEPHDFVGFQCVVAAEGGESAMLAVDDVLGRLSMDDAAFLKRPEFPFSRGNFPILEASGQQNSIRYYRTQIDQAVADGASLPEGGAEVLDRLDAVLADETLAHLFKLEEGEAALFNNKKVLHARRGFDETSGRKLFRIRYKIDLERAARPSSLFSGLVGPGRKATTPSPRVAEKTTPLDQNTPAPIDPLVALRERVDTAPNDAPAVAGLADILVARGRFREAAPYVDQALDLVPDDKALLEMKAGLLYAENDLAGMQAVMGRIAAAHPFVAPRKPDPRKSLVLQTRGLFGAKYRLSQRGKRYSPSFESGHFATKDLFNSSDYNLTTMHVFDQAPSLDGLEGMPQLLVNTIACADRMPVALNALNSFVEAYPDIPVINHPAKVLRTSRAENATRLSGIDGLVFPATLKLTWAGGDVAALRAELDAANISFPLIIRPSESHTGVGVMLLKDEAALSLYLAGLDVGREVYLIQYHDLQGNDGFYRKTRTFCIDGRYYPVASLVHSDWNVHSGDRYAVMDKNPDLQAAEQEYLNDMPDWLGEENQARLAAVRDLIDLDFFGVDFAKMPDGRIILFEVNAAMRHNFDHAGAFPYTAPHLRAVSRAFQKMVQRRVGQLSSQWLSLSGRLGH